MSVLATYWSMTINNPDENDYLLVRNPNEKYVRQLVWTPEEGENGTPHIQAWIRLQRNNSMAFVKKLWPRGHFRYITKDDYNENTQQYAQKEDATTAGVHTISINDPIPGVDTILYKVLQRIVEEPYDDQPPWANDWTDKDIIRITRRIESQMVRERAGLEKLFVSATYNKMKMTFWHEILYRLHARQEEAQEVSVPMINGTEDDSQGEDSDSSEGGQSGQSVSSEDDKASECGSDDSGFENQEDSGQED